MVENEGDRPVVAGRVLPSREMLLGLLGVYLIFFLVFGYFLIAGPFATNPAHDVTTAANTSMSIRGASPRQMAGNHATLGRLSTAKQPGASATPVSDWSHPGSGSSPLR